VWREQVLAPDGPPQPFRDGDQQEVAAIAAEPVVDVVEGVQIDQHQAQSLPPQASIASCASSSNRDRLASRTTEPWRRA
jgi:hypothetical protein